MGIKKEHCEHCDAPVDPATANYHDGMYTCGDCIASFDAEVREVQELLMADSLPLCWADVIDGMDTAHGVIEDNEHDVHAVLWAVFQLGCRYGAENGADTRA
jgi:hypothetical protein